MMMMAKFASLTLLVLTFWRLSDAQAPPQCSTLNVNNPLQNPQVGKLMEHQPYVCVSLVPRRFSAIRRKKFLPPFGMIKSLACETMFVSSHSLRGLVCRKSLMRN